MVVIGVAGGIASGKSLVSEQLRQLGAEILDADRAGHEVLHEEEVKRALRARWGDAIFRDDGEIDRPAVARIVFAPPPDGPEQLAFLEQISHPRIELRLRRQIAALAAGDQQRAVVLDAAVMFKAGWDRLCDKIIFVDAPRPARLARCRQRGWSAEQFTAREASQSSLDEKRSRADCVIDNSGSAGDTLAQIREFWNSLP